MTIEIPEQPMPPAISRACGLLSAAERHESDLTDSAAVRAAGAAGDALDTLLDVTPRYAPFDQGAPPRPLAAVEPDARAALAQAATEATSAEAALRIARALRALDEARS